MTTYTTPAGYTAPTTAHPRAHEYKLSFNAFPSRVVDTFAELKVTLSPEVEEALAQQATALASLARFEAPNTHLANAAKIVIEGGDPTDELLKASVGDRADTLRTEVTRQLNSNLIRSINHSSDRLIKNLGSQAFEPTITELAKLHTKWNLRADGSVLVTNNEFDHAKAVHRAGELVARLNRIKYARNAIHPDAYRWTSAYVRETNGLEVIHNYMPESLDEWATLLDNNRTFWFPTISEALHLKDWHDQEGNRQLDSQADREKAARVTEAATIRG